MLIQQQPDWGIGYSMLAGTDFQALIELSAVMWLAEYVPALDGIPFPSGVKIYGRYSLPFEKIAEIDGVKTDENYFMGFLGFGLSKDLHFAHYFSVTPYVGYQMMLISEKDRSMIEGTSKPLAGFEAGINGSIAVLHNLQITGNAGWSTLKAVWFSTGLSTGGGIRYQF
jgi:hypothetical protein